MFRSSVFKLVIIIILITSLSYGKNIAKRKRQLSSTTRKPTNIKICGLALVRMLDMVCTKARELLKKNGISSSLPEKREFNLDDDPYSHTVSITDYAQFNDTLVGDCCLQACTIKILLKYC